MGLFSSNLAAESSEVRIITANVLYAYGRAQRAGHFINCLTRLLQHKDFAVQFQAARSLSEETHLAGSAREALIQALTQLLDYKDEKNEVQRFALNAIFRQTRLPGQLWGTPLPEQALDKLTSLLMHKNFDVRHSAAKTLRLQTNLQGRARKALMQTLFQLLDQTAGKKKDLTFAVDLPLKQNRFPDHGWEVCTEMIQNPSLRSSVVLVLRGEKHLPGSVVGSLVPLLQLEDSGVQCRVVEVLSQLTDLTAQVFEATTQCLLKLLQDQNPDVRLNAARIIDSQNNLTAQLVDAKIQALVDILRGHDPLTQDAATRELALQTSLPVPVLNDISHLFRHEDPDVQLSALIILYGQTNIPRDVFEATFWVLIELLQRWRRGLKLRMYVEALKLLSMQPSWPQPAVLAALRFFEGLNAPHYRCFWAQRQ